MDQSLKVGDLVCNCSGRHVAITEIDPDDPESIVTADGLSCSLWHCCTEIQEDNSCHGVFTDMAIWYEKQGIPMPASIYRYFGFDESWIRSDAWVDNPRINSEA